MMSLIYRLSAFHAVLSAYSLSLSFAIPRGSRDFALEVYSAAYALLILPLPSAMTTLMRAAHAEHIYRPHHSHHRSIAHVVAGAPHALRGASRVTESGELPMPEILLAADRAANYHFTIVTQTSRHGAAHIIGAISRPALSPLLAGADDLFCNFNAARQPRTSALFAKFQFHFCFPCHRPNAPTLVRC